MSWLSSLFGGSTPTWNGGQYVQEAQNYVPTAQSFQNAQSQLFNTAEGQGIDFARQGTQANINNQNAVTPGSSNQRELALDQLNSYIQGQVPTDVQQNTQRSIAQSFGGGYNPFSGGGQAPSAFARDIGQTSLGISQYGLSAAPTWQQLANSMVVSPTVGLSAGLQAGSIANQQILGTAGLGMQAAGLGLQNSQDAYQAQMNQYAAQQQQAQSIANLGLGLVGSGIQGINANTMANYYSQLSPSGQGAASTIGSILPNASDASNFMSLYGGGTGAGLSALAGA